ncbi:filamentous hemagglutinin N-terminal domain-containing protein [Nostoc commune]|uniref:two-partner secretion domain-containing protein n=1 Tax=Nostoc commune TaxID=1178 RepID=UPI0018C48F56|nr:filamentous hemagglutinin N-terminal domain-containing protein [Nostoc commune]MBG1259957.1 filamentous hemagglutinin N-terminal domain-containing protein [Nostoc commune BAE]
MSGLGFTHWGALAAIAVGVSFCPIDYASAQITPDGTLPNNSSVTREGDTFNITGGTQAGGNLFHSFGEFSVPTGSTADFNNALDIQNIITRVTGGSVSNIDIDGLIRTLGTANLFLTNPNGIVFGENASLNVGGSFVATSANALQFGNRGFFSATDKNIPSEFLTANPSALLFNQINQNGGIQNNSLAPAGTDPAGLNAFGLRVPDGKSLLLVGGNVSMDKGRLNAYGGRAELGGLAQAGTVALGVDGDNLSLIFPDNVARTSVSLTNQAGVIVTGAGGGNIAVNARNLEILGGSILSAGIGQGLGTPETVAGDITLNATESIKVAGTGSNVRNLVGLGSLGNGGNITIDSGSLSLQNGAELIASTSGLGNAGDVTVRARNAVTLADADIFNAVDSGGVGKGGNIDINAATLLLIDSAQLATITREASDTQPAGRGDAGNVNVNVTDAVDISGEKNGIQSKIGSFVGTGTVGNGGNITINSGSFSLRDGAQVTASTLGQDNAGTITVNAAQVNISGKSSNINSGLFVNSQSTTGSAGDIIVTSPRVTLDNTSGLNAESSSGNGGNISLQVQDLLLLHRQNLVPISSGGNISTNSTDVISMGNGGNISINPPAGFIIAKPVPEPTFTFSVFALTAFYAGWKLKRKHKQTNELKA